MKTKRSIRTKTAPRQISAQGKLSILHRVRGIWKKRKPEPVRQLRSLRQEWE